MSTCSFNMRASKVYRTLLIKKKSVEKKSKEATMEKMTSQVYAKNTPRDGWSL